MCLENGSWSGSPPNCKEITCAPPAAADDSGVLVTVASSTVGGLAVYSCQEGRRLVGTPSRKCMVSGLWEGNQPDCECKIRLSFISLKTAFNNCFIDRQGWIVTNRKKWKMVVSFWSMALQFTVVWLNITACPVTNDRDLSAGNAALMADGPVPSRHVLVSLIRKKKRSKFKVFHAVFDFVEEGKVVTPLQDNGLDSLSAGRQSSGSGIWIGIGTGLILVLFVIIALFYCKMYLKLWWSRDKTS